MDLFRRRTLQKAVTNLFLVPVNDDWIEDYQQTVAAPLSVDNDAPTELEKYSELRVWGTTIGDSPQKRTSFEAMEPGDALLFLHDGVFIGSARVDETFESTELGKWIWNNPKSEFVYTLTDYREISVPRQEVWNVLGYSSNYPLYGFSRASEDAISSLLQQYNSVEEAFQAFRQQDDDTADGESNGDPTAGDDNTEPKENQIREHTEIQWFLIQLGLEHGYDVYVTTNDQNLTYQGQRLGEDCIDELTLTGFSEAAMRLIEYVDVIWLNGDYIEKMFEVESTTSIFSGILRMTDFVVKVPNLAVDMHIVAPTEDEDQVRRQMTRPTFQHIMDQAQHCSLQYLSFEEVKKRQNTVEHAGPLQSVF